MSGEILIAPSMLASDFGRLNEEVSRAEEAGADWLHLDVMDGLFVDNISFGMDVVEVIANAATRPIDVHIMIEEPEQFSSRFIDAGADYLTFHIEAFLEKGRQREWTGMGWQPLIQADQVELAIDRARDLCAKIREQGAKAGISLNPGTDISWLEPFYESVDLVLAMSVWPGFGGQSFIETVLEKVQWIATHVVPGTHIEVDGGISPATVAGAAAAGANVFVAGTATFRAPDMAGAVKEIREAARENYVAPPG